MPKPIQYPLSDVVQNMKPSGIRIFFDLVLGMKDVVSLGVGEPDFVTPWVIREAGIAALEQGFTSYTSNKGLMKLRMAIARHLKERHGLKYCPETEILITVGVSEGLDLAMRAIVNPGDEVLIGLPSYVSYGPTVELAGGKPVYIDTQKDGFKLTPRSIEKHLTRRTKAILFAYPNNPTGVSYTKAELEAIKRTLIKRGIFCLSDELYSDLTYEGVHTPFPTLAGAKERTLYLNGFSKNYAMTGWRVGYVCGPEPIVAAMTKIHQYTMLCPPIVSQIAAAEALHAGRSAMESMKREYNRRRRFIISALDLLGLDYVRPQGAFYFFFSVKKTGMTAMDFATKLLKEHKVAVVPGTAFGDEFEDWIRISYASSFEKIKEAFRRIGLFLGV
jgi:aminotransferase